MKRREPLRKEEVLPRESGTAPSGLPPTCGETTYSKLSEAQLVWEKDQKSLYNRMKVRIQDEAKITVGEDGEVDFNFQLSKFFPSVRGSWDKNE